MHRIITLNRKQIVVGALCLLLLAAAGFAVRLLAKPAVPEESIRPAIENCLREVREEFAPDPRTAVFQIAYELNGSTLDVYGEVMAEGPKQALTVALRTVPGVRRINNRVMIFPLLPDKDKTAGIVAATVTNLYREPDPGSDIVTQAVLGEVLILLEKKNGLFLVRMENAYLGWVLAGDIRTVSEAEKEAYQKQINRAVISSLAPLYQSPDVNSPVVINAVAPSYLAAGSSQGDWLPVALPDGRRVWVLNRHTQEIDYPCLPARAGKTVPGNGGAVAAAAARYCGIPYAWGGVSSLGIDCSGYTQMIYRLIGIILPRDADQQYTVGAAVAKDELLPGDLVFFGAGRSGEAGDKPSHVGIYAGGGRFIHAGAAGGKVSVSNLSGAASFLGARRIVGGAQALD